MLKLPLDYINKKCLSNFESIMNVLNHVCFLDPMNMLKCYNFFSTFELNAWEDTWIVAIKALQEGKMKENKVGKEKVI